MNELEREELLSAYLDGEVSPEERARVEQWLSESTEFRQLRDELLALRVELRGLPRHRVGHDMASAVIKKSTATGSNLVEPKPADSGVAPVLNDAPVSLRGTISEWWSSGSQSRRFLWPVLAVAAALAILVFDARQRPEEFEVAKAPPAESEPAEPAAAAAAGELLGDEMPSIQAAPADAPAAGEEIVARGLVAGSKLAQEAEGKAEMPPEPPAVSRSENFYAKPGAATTRSMAPAEDRSADAPQPVAPAGQAVLGMREKASPDSAAVDTIVCPVTPEYLEERQFEKLLDASQVKWRRVPVPPQLQSQLSESPRSTTLESLGRNPLQLLYVIQADSAQVNAILSQVPQADRLMEGNRMRTMKSPSQQAKRQAAGVQVMLVAPGDASAPASAPAQPARPSR